MTARDPSPSARIYIADILNEIDTLWAKMLWKDLCRDPNPLVREACVRIAAEKNQVVYPQEPLKRLPKIEKHNNESDTDGPKNKQKTYTSRSTTDAPENTKIPYTPFEQKVQNHINFRAYPYQKINDQYLNAMRDFIDPNTYGHKKYDTLERNSQGTCIKLIAATLSSKYVFEKLLVTLPGKWVF